MNTFENNIKMKSGLILIKLGRVKKIEADPHLVDEIQIRPPLVMSSRHRPPFGGLYVVMNSKGGPASN